ncbi:MAG: hypothetical protein KIH69_021540 [Anaerolineae bacterium]|nr:hypothetical protein [Anaerolineae bacterium]
MNTYMAVATFKPNTNMGDVQAVIPEEQAQVARLRSAGQVGAIHLSLARGTIFIEVFAQDEAQAVNIVASLPISRWWTADFYPTSAPLIPKVGAA